MNYEPLAMIYHFINPDLFAYTFIHLTHFGYLDTQVSINGKEGSAWRGNAFACWIPLLNTFLYRSAIRSTVNSFPVSHAAVRICKSWSRLADNEMILLTKPSISPTLTR